MTEMREAIEKDSFSTFRNDFYGRLEGE